MRMLQAAYVPHVLYVVRLWAGSANVQQMQWVSPTWPLLALHTRSQVLRGGATCGGGGEVWID